MYKNKHTTKLEIINKKQDDQNNFYFLYWITFKFQTSPKTKYDYSNI